MTTRLEWAERSGAERSGAAAWAERSGAGAPPRRRKALRTARGAQRRRVDTVARDEQRGELEPAVDELVDIEPAEL